MSLKMEDTVKNRTYPKRPFAWYVEKPSAKDYLLTVFIFAVCTLIGLLFQKLDLTDTNIVTIYILGVLITSIVTDGGISGDIFHNAYFVRTYRNPCGKAENACKAVFTDCLSHTGSV